MPEENKIPVSVYIITLNEAENLCRLLPQLKAFQEVIIVDCGSTDDTESVARRHPNVKWLTRAWSSYSEQKSYALSQCNNEWVLNLDADEELTTAFLEEIAATILDPDCIALESCRLEHKWGRRSNNLALDKRLIRLFKKRHGFYEPRRVHERVTVNDGKIRKTSAYLIHHQDMTYEEAIQKYNKYSQLRAMDKYEHGAHASLIVLLLIFPWTFVQHYIFKAYFLAGMEGWINSMNMAFYHFMKYAKLWELRHYKEAEIKHFGAVPDRQQQLKY